jgi:hypothetical protein
LQKERIQIERDRVYLQRELEKDRIMNIDMSTLSYKHQQYYEKRQDEIMARRINMQSWSVGYLCHAQSLDRLLSVSWSLNGLGQFVMLVKV